MSLNTDWHPVLTPGGLWAATISADVKLAGGAALRFRTEDSAGVAAEFKKTGPFAVNVQDAHFFAWLCAKATGGATDAQGLIVGRLQNAAGPSGVTEVECKAGAVGGYWFAVDDNVATTGTVDWRVGRGPINGNPASSVLLDSGSLPSSVLIDDGAGGPGGLMARLSIETTEDGDVAIQVTRSTMVSPEPGNEAHWPDIVTALVDTDMNRILPKGAWGVAANQRSATSAAFVYVDQGGGDVINVG